MKCLILCKSDVDLFQEMSHHTTAQSSAYSKLIAISVRFGSVHTMITSMLRLAMGAASTNLFTYLAASGNWPLPQ